MPSHPETQRLFCMPFIEKSSYRSRPFYMINSHWETIVPSVFFKGPEMGFSRSRFDLPDKDFLDVDFLKKGNEKMYDHHTWPGRG